MSKKIPSLPVPLFKGRVKLVTTYRDQLIPGYRGNPLIEALPDIWSPEQVTKAMMCYPEFKEEYRAKEGYERYHFIYDAVTDFFQPLLDHVDIEQRFSRLIRLGYKRRNPTNVDFWMDMKRRLELLKKNMGLDFEDLEDDLQQASKQCLEQTSEQEPLVCTCGNARAFGFNLIGISGIGKTTAVQKVLSLYPQILFHSRYEGRDFPWTQIAWLKLDIPHDASIKGLCLNFFQAVDSILSTEYFARFTRNGKATATEMIPRMAWVAGLHTIGVLVFDELQNLNVLSSGGYQVMLNFFVRLDNDMGIPIQETGTYAACSFLGKQLHKARRGAGQGDKFWHPMMRKEKKWEHFLESLWQYQYVRNPIALSDDLKDVMHDVTQGITDFAVNVFMLSQIRAIKIAENRGAGPGGEPKEVLSESVIRSVAADSLNSARPILDALRSRDEQALLRYEDTRIDWETIWADELGEDGDLPVLKGFVLDRDDDETAMTASEQSGELADEDTPKKESSSRRSKRKLSKRTLKGSLPELLEHAEEKKVLAYDALKEAGYIRNSEEFLQAEVA